MIAKTQREHKREALVQQAQDLDQQGYLKLEANAVEAHRIIEQSRYATNLLVVTSSVRQKVLAVDYGLVILRTRRTERISSQPCGLNSFGKESATNGAFGFS